MISLLITGFAWHLSSNFVRERAIELFESQSDDLTAAIVERMHDYEAVLRSGVGLIATTGDVSRDQWRIYFQELALETHYPGIQGIGYSQWLSEENLPAFEEQIRAEGFPEFRVHPPGSRDAYSAIKYLEPFDWRNRRAFGYDMASEPVRREAMTHASRTGKTAMSGKVTLVQETDTDVQSGFLMYLPVYTNNITPETEDARMAALQGFVYAPFRMNDLMDGILGSTTARLSFHVHDGTVISDDTLMYASPIAEHSKSTDLLSERSLLIGERAWTVHIRSDLDDLTRSDSALPTIIAIAGLVIDLLLFLIILGLSQRHARAKKRVQQMTAALNQESEMFISAFTNVATGAIVINDKGVIQIFNRAAERMFGYTAEESIGKNVKMLMPQPDKGRHDSYIHNYLTTHDPKIVGIGRNVTGCRKDGSHFPMHLGVGEIQTRDRTLFIGSVTDLSDLVEAKSALEDALTAAEQANQAKSSFLAAMSHELRTPLNAIIGFSEILRDEVFGPLETRYAEYAQDINKSGRHLLALVNDILDISAIEAGKRSLDFDRVDVAEIIAEALGLVMDRATAKHIEIHEDLDPSVPTITADHRGLLQILINLLTNSVKFTPENGQIAVIVKKAGPSAQFMVQDTGRGISEDQLPLITEMFTKEHNDAYKSDEGWGLGLAITRALVDMHSGRLDVQSKKGKGTTVTITLPIEPSST